MTDLVIGNQVITDDSPVFFIAEIGINHNGSLENAKKLIDLAVLCGADAVKFQKRNVDMAVPRYMWDRIRETPWGEMSYYEYKKRLEFSHEQYKEIDRYCMEKDIMWTASAWDLDSLDFIEQFNPPFHKVPSALLTHRELLESLKSLGKPVVLSTGMSSEEEIVQAVHIFGEGYPLIILHCNSEYPAKDANLNLRYIQKLENNFPWAIIGYSGHELGISASLIAATLGAKVIERHITLDRAMWGTDHAASIEMDGLRRLIRDLKKIPIWLGKNEKIVTDGELVVKKKLRYRETL